MCVPKWDAEIAGWGIRVESEGALVPPGELETPIWGLTSPTILFHSLSCSSRWAGPLGIQEIEKVEVEARMWT